ncbi:MAG: pbpC [Magnetococcales bacterium]|nr:pbpC [Magnetococcales bacterium]HIJ84857.1 penicillin-binding protein 1C [Magnetococcales bacterium]
MLGLASLGGWLLWGWGAPVPTFADVKNAWQASDGLLLDRKGEELHEMRVSLQGRRLTWISLNEISPTALAVLVAAEDRRFRKHGGVDGWGLAAGFWGWLTGSGHRGASTITMQLAGLLEKKPSGSRGKRRSLAHKWEQMRSAWGLEAGWSKDELLEAYLNRVTFRGEWEGIGTAARGLFGKGVGGLTRGDGVVLAALLRSPNANAEKILARACRLAIRIAPELTCEELQKNIEKNIAGGRWIAPTRADAPQLARRLLTRGGIVHTTLDAALQRFIRETLAEQLAQLEGQNVHNGAVLVLANESGEVLAYVGNTPSAESSSQVDGIQALRQAGSTLKPFLYEWVLEKRLLTAASLLNDAPLNIPTPRGLYVPRNYEEDFKGWVSVRTALAASLNVPTIKALLLAGLDPVVFHLRRLGFSGVSQGGDTYGPSLALGSVDVSLWQLTNAYRTLANGGVFSPLRLIPGEDGTAKNKVMGAEATFIINDILSDPLARAVTFGLDNPLNLPFWSAVKTGTSKGMRDNWCVGFSQAWTVGVWVGNFDGESMHDVSGIAGAAPVWREVMTYLGGNEQKPQVPPGVVKKKTLFSGGEEGERWEWYLSGTEMERVERIHNRKQRGHILYPVSGVVMALDPDIPPPLERVFFRMEPPHPGYRWRLDGVEINLDEGWAPVAGRHRLELLDEAGKTVDQANFEVRGSRGK